MRTVPPRPPLLRLATACGALVAGPLMGVQLGRGIAPGSEVAEVVGVLAFAIPFLGGLLLWLGTGVLAVALSALRSLLRGRPPGPPGLRPGDLLVPPGYRWFPVLAGVSSAAGGLLVAAASSATLLAALVGYLGLGLAYGLALQTLAHHGYLPFPEPE